ncbi:MAG: heme exporter protein CcmD [Psychrobium sp.]|nr:heme exporter protein CcmD [Psychrobium sp.]
MHFSNFADFIDMGGYGFYVWLAYGITFGLLLILTLSSIFKRKSLFKEINAKQRRDEKLQKLRAGNKNHEP